MEQWYDSLTPENPEWILMAVRNTTDPPLLTYLLRLHRSIHEIFAPWFCGRAESPFNYLPYTEILKQQHIALVIGHDNAPTYTGITCKEHGIMSNYVVLPGQFRHKVVLPNTWPHNMTFRFTSKFSEENLSPRLRKLIQGYIDDPSLDKVIEPTEGAHCSIDVIQLPRLNCKVSIWNKIYAHYITHHYPDHKDKDLILNTMTMIINEIRQACLEKEEHQLESILPKLEEYLYHGIHAHPFESVNFSIIMSQVNFMLSRCGLKGLSPSNLDWIGLAEQFPEFQIVFRKKLTLRNPWIEKLGITTTILPRSHWISILAHISDEGDQYFQEGILIEHTTTAVRKHIEGLMITSAIPDDLIVEYKGHIQNLGDTDWVQERTFMGTWGRSLALEGVMFRLTGSPSSKYQINYLARLGESEWTSICRNGEFCGTRGQSKPITGLRIWITFM